MARGNRFVPALYSDLVWKAVGINAVESSHGHRVVFLFGTGSAARDKWLREMAAQQKKEKDQLRLTRKQKAALRLFEDAA